MTRTDLEGFRRTLLALRSRLNGNLSNLASEATNGKGGAHADPADMGVDVQEQEFTLSLIQNEGQVLEEIADALERIRKGTYGKCEECGGTILRPRLQALPYTRHCVKCARRVQQST